MAEGCRAKRENGGAYLGVGDDLDAEDVGKARAAVVAKGAKDEVLALLVEDEDSREHGEDGVPAGRDERGIGCCWFSMLGCPLSRSGEVQGHARLRSSRGPHARLAYGHWWLHL